MLADSEAVGNFERQGLHAITLGSVVPGRNIVDTHFARRVECGFRNLAADKGINPGGGRCFDEALRGAGTPGNAFDRMFAAADGKRPRVEAGFELLGQLREAGWLRQTPLEQQPLLAMAPSDRMLARALVTAGVLRRLQPGQRAGVNILGELREGEVYSMGVEAVRVELQGAVYQLDVVFDRRPDELLRPSEKVQILLP